MFWSKIWMFLLASVAAVALAIAFAAPRPSQRQIAAQEEVQLANARTATEIVLRSNAREFIDMAASFASAPAPPTREGVKLGVALAGASAAASLPDDAVARARETLDYFMKEVKGALRPEFALGLDRYGRLVAASGETDRRPGDDLSGYFVIRDGLRGYLRDDLWLETPKLYRVAVAPVIEGVDYAGVVVLGDEVDSALAQALQKRVGPQVAFFAKGRVIAQSSQTPFVEDILAAYDSHRAALDARDEQGRPVAVPPLAIHAGGDTYRLALGRLPGEVGAQDGFLALYSSQQMAPGFLGMVKQITKDDVGFGRFPWIPLLVAFVVMVGLGLTLLWLESERHVRRLAEDAIRLGKGEADRLTEEWHSGRHGSIARSVNIAIEKLAREAKAGAKRDLGAALGPPPANSILGGASARRPGDSGLQTPVGEAPARRPSESGLHAAVSPPPASPGPTFDFEFGDNGPGSGLRASPSEPTPVRPVPTAQRPAPIPLGAEPAAPSRPVEGSRPTGRTVPPRGAPPPIPTTATPGTLPPGAVPGSRAPGTLPPGTLPPGTLPPGTLPPGAVPGSRARVNTPIPSAQVPSLDDDLMGPADLPNPTVPDFGDSTVVSGPSPDLLRKAGEDDSDVYFRQVYSDFVALKQKCGETLEGLSFEKFALKLRQNREQLVSKYACKSVKFQVYVKDGKAALKATPVKA